MLLRASFDLLPSNSSFQAVYQHLHYIYGTRLKRRTGNLSFIISPSSSLLLNYLLDLTLFESAQSCNHGNSPPSPPRRNKTPSSNLNTTSKSSTGRPPKRDSKAPLIAILLAQQLVYKNGPANSNLSNRLTLVSPLTGKFVNPSPRVSHTTSTLPRMIRDGSLHQAPTPTSLSTTWLHTTVEFLEARRLVAPRARSALRIFS